MAVAALEFLHGDLLRAPRRVGHELQRQLAGTWSARRGAYRILYEIHDDPGSATPSDPDLESAEVGTVLVVDIGHRSDVYRPR